VRIDQPVPPAGAPSVKVGIDQHLAAIRSSEERIHRGDTSAIAIYNHSVARLVEEIERSGIDPWSGPVSCSGASGSFRLKGIHPAGCSPLDHHLMPTDALEFRSEIAEWQSKVDGLGAPLVDVGALDKLGHQKLRDNLPLQNAPNSIGTLSPTNPFVVEINKFPIVPRVPFHSIMGDRGKGDTPNSSDGVVAYWSSHLKGAVSEKIVPSGHGSHENPEGIEEARRILLLHLKNR
jgi:hypothetical protein